MRVAYQLAQRIGVADVDRLLDSLEPRQFDRWRALAIVDGWSDGWIQVGVIAAAAANAGKLAAAAAAGVELDKIAWAKPEDFLPKLDDEPEPPAARALTSSEAKRRAQLRFGR